jgi:hypothetical protein
LACGYPKPHVVSVPHLQALTRLFPPTTAKAGHAKPPSTPSLLLKEKKSLPFFASLRDPPLFLLNQDQSVAVLCVFA